MYSTLWSHKVFCFVFFERCVSMSKVNKSQLIRDFHLANPAAKPMQIAQALKQQKVKVTNLYVSMILSKLKNQPVNEKGEFIPAKRGRKPNVEAVVVAPAKRGRPKATEAVITPPKRGRKPNVEAVVVAPAKRGRPKATEAVTPAKRGRKPADKMALLINGLRELATKLEQQVA
jgi:hypothetical protein